MFRYSELQLARQRDNFKKQMCGTYGFTLIVVPYWWDGTVESIATTIHLKRPDIMIPSHLLKGGPIPDKAVPHGREIGKYSRNRPNASSTV